MHVRPLSILQKLATVALACLMSAACAQNKPYPPRPEPTPTTPGNTLPYSVAFTLQGEPVVLGPDGRPLPPRRINFPIPGRNVKAITRMVNFNAIEVLGSHYLVYCFGPGFCFCIDLPHPDGTVANTCTQLAQ